MKNMLLVAIATFAAIAAVGTVIALSSPSQVLTQSESTSAISGGFASITTEQSDNKIVITIERDPNAPGTGGEIPTVPEGPIIIVPDPGGEGNGTVIVPPVDNQTGGSNETGAIEPPVIVIDPDGNATEVQPPSNVTVIDNGTVIVAPPNQTITETPGNVTIIDPAPPANVTEPEPCGCPSSPSPPAAPTEGAPPVSSDNTTVIVEPPAPAQLPADTSNGNGDDGNGDGDEGGG